MSMLTQVSAEHRDRLMAHVDLLLPLADAVGRTPWPELRDRVAAEQAFYATSLIPHMEAVESGIHKELDRLLSCRLAMEPIEREHVQVRQLVAHLGGIAGLESLTLGHELELYRVLVKLYAILKVHLREEWRYLPLLEHNLEPSELDTLAVSLEHTARVEL